MAKILLVEDDNNLREIYEARLQAEGYEIVSARDGEEALTVAMKERPDLIISDVMMPKISGFDMLDIIRSTEETKNAKVIMMTALSQAEDKERATKLGADRYLVKSQVTLEDVAKVAREVLNEDSAQTAPVDVPAPTPPAVVQTPVTPEPAIAAPVDEPFVETPAPEPVTASNDTSATAATPEPAIPALAAIAPATEDQSTAPLEQSVEDEQSAIAAQIESFIEVKKTENIDSAPAPTEPVIESPAEPVKPETEQSTQEQVPPADASETTGKKVIQPLSDPTQSKGPDLDHLLKKEEEKEQMAEIAKAVTTEKSSVDDELSAGVAPDSATRDPQYTATEDVAVDSPQLTITENGDLEVKSPPSDTPLEPETPSELIDSSSVPKVDNATPIIPHSNGTSLDGVVQPSQPNPATNAETPPAGGVDPNSIAL